MCIHGDKSQQERDWVLSGECLNNPVTSWICNMNCHVSELVLMLNDLTLFQSSGLEGPQFWWPQM